MKRALVVIAGAFALLGVGILIVIGLSDWITEKFIRSDDDMNTLGKIILLGLYPMLILIGGWLGNALYQRNLTGRSSGRPEGRR